MICAAEGFRMPQIKPEEDVEEFLEYFKRVTLSAR